MSPTRRIRICLYGLVSPVLIVPWRTGIHYFNQTHGVCCAQSELEGFLVPVESETLGSDLEGLFPEGHYGDIQPPVGERIDELLHAAPNGLDIRVDWERFEDSHEAWLHVVINSPEGPFSERFSNQPAIMTWNNSD